MRKLKIATYNSEIENNEEYKKLMGSAMLKCIDRYKEEQLLDDVRKGDAAAIQKLVESCEPVIMHVIKQLGNFDDIQKSFNEGKKALTQLAQI